MIIILRIYFFIFVIGKDLSWLIVCVGEEMFGWCFVGVEIGFVFLGDDVVICMKVLNVNCFWFGSCVFWNLFIR